MTPSSDEISEMFSEISPKYDLANRILSVGFDIGWRKQLIKYSQVRDHDRVLDLATGTADLVLDFSKINNSLDIIGLDLSRRMLEVGLPKSRKFISHNDPILVEGDALKLPFESSVIDVLSISFGLRNLTNYQAGLTEMTRVLKSEGRLMILEFSLPNLKPLRAVYKFYLKHILPVVGGLITGSRSAYTYLHDSICEFPLPERIQELMSSSGLGHVEAKYLLGGIAVLYKGVKP